MPLGPDSRVRVTWTDGTPDVDQVMPSWKVHGFLLPISTAPGTVVSGNSRGGIICRFVDGVLVRVGRIDVSDVPVE